MNIFDNKQAFLNLKPKSHKFIMLTSFIILSLMLTLLIKIKVSSNYQTKGYVVCENKCFITTSIPTSIKLNQLSINNKLVDYTILNKTLELDEKNLISYFNINLLTDYHGKENEIVNISFYYDKQSILKKWWNSIF